MTLFLCTELKIVKTKEIQDQLQDAVAPGSRSTNCEMQYQ